MSITDCSLVYSNLTHPTTTVYIALFILVGLLATVGNVLALVILLKPAMRNKSNIILTSLALSDTLVGCMLCPLTVYQLIETKVLADCTHEFVRIFLSISLIGTSALNVGYIAYDRYILLTRLNLKPSGKGKTIAFLVLSWIVPPACVSLNWVNIYPFIGVLCLIIFGPLITLAVFYCFITKVIKRKEKHTFRVNSVIGEDNLERKNTMTMRKNLKARHLKLAKQVTLLVVFYIICLLPSGIALIVNMVYIVTETFKTESIQNFFIFSLLAAASNSCINPMIYASKYPEFRRCLRQMLSKGKMRKWNVELSHSNHTVESSV